MGGSHSEPASTDRIRVQEVAGASAPPRARQGTRAWARQRVSRGGHRFENYFSRQMQRLEVGEAAWPLRGQPSPGAGASELRGAAAFSHVSPQRSFGCVFAGWPEFLLVPPGCTAWPCHGLSACHVPVLGELLMAAPSSRPCAALLPKPSVSGAFLRSTDRLSSVKLLPIHPQSLLKQPVTGGVGTARERRIVTKRALGLCSLPPCQARGSEVNETVLASVEL